MSEVKVWPAAAAASVATAVGVGALAAALFRPWVAHLSPSPRAAAVFGVGAVCTLAAADWLGPPRARRRRTAHWLVVQQTWYASANFIPQAGVYAWTYYDPGARYAWPTAAYAAYGALAVAAAAAAFAAALFLADAVLWRVGVGGVTSLAGASHSYDVEMSAVVFAANARRAARAAALGPNVRPVAPTLVRAVMWFAVWAGFMATAGTYRGIRALTPQQPSEARAWAAAGAVVAAALFAGVSFGVAAWFGAAAAMFPRSHWLLNDDFRGTAWPPRRREAGAQQIPLTEMSSLAEARATGGHCTALTLAVFAGLAFFELLAGAAKVDPAVVQFVHTATLFFLSVFIGFVVWAFALSLFYCVRLIPDAPAAAPAAAAAVAPAPASAPTKPAAAAAHHDEETGEKSALLLQRRGPAQ